MHATADHRGGRGNRIEGVIMVSKLWYFLKCATAMQKHPRSVIEHPAHIALLASPARQELIDTLDALGGEASVSELSAQLGRAGPGLYYHLRLLARAGLIEELAGEAGERRYRVPSAMRLRYRPGKTANARAVSRFAHGMVRIATRDFDAALRDPGVISEGPKRTLWAARVKGWIGEADLVELNRLIGRLSVLISPQRMPRRDRLVALTWVLAPLGAKRARGPRRRRRAKPRTQ
ncbi:MAG TPA: winged helix-turn-helix domain-containing protein [Kofleriaceae bacterium]|jgi:DNA-binding transcriptional ArsR family regulator|nr:winged helix-turn-helix domain-containing protein [Kofleriaceae bacterium]